MERNKIKDIGNNTGLQSNIKGRETNGRNLLYWYIKMKWSVYIHILYITCIV